MVVKNTGLGFINGAFTNLPQGQIVTLTYNGSGGNTTRQYHHSRDEPLGRSDRLYPGRDRERCRGCHLADVFGE